MRLPIPDDWDGKNYALMLVCIPDSVQWRAICRGAIYGLTLGRSWDEATGIITDVQGITREVYNNLMVCKLDDLLNEFKRLNAILAGEQATEKDEDGKPLYDYRKTGIRPTLHQIGIAPVSWSDDLGSILTGEMSLAEIAKSGLIGRRLDLTPMPFEGSGLADIVDEQIEAANENLEILNSRLIISDFGLDSTPFTKTITEVFEKALRVDSTSDFEIFSPNIATILSNTLQLNNELGWIHAFKEWVARQASAGNLPQWVADIFAPGDENKTITEAILALLPVLEAMYFAQNGIAAAVTDSATVINVNNVTNCGGGNGTGTGATGPNGQITITDDGVNVQIDQPQPNPLLDDGA